MMTKTDPTKDPEFQKVMKTFLRTKPRPHKPKKKRNANRGAKRAKSNIQSG
jgi:hypothetical protein